MNYFNYFTEIEETFIRRRGKHLLLSPLDWALIESWQERDIPLRIVLRGIENVFDSIDKNPNRKRTVKSLTYCREEIEAQYAEWLETQVGKSNSKSEKTTENKKPKKQQSESQNESTLFSDETIISHLENAINLINKAKAKSDGTLRQVLERVEKKLSEYKKTQTDAENLEESLNDLEDSIDKALLETINSKTLEKTKSQIEKELAQHKLKMEEDVYQRTFDLMLLKKLREGAEIPRLSLFYF